MQQTLLIPLTFLRTQDPVPQNTNAPAERPVGAGNPVAPGPAGTQVPGGTGNPAPQQACGGELLWMMPLFLVLMYVMAIRPEQKRRKESQKMLADMKAGDTVVTIGGMHGVVHQVLDRTLVLRVDAIKVTIDKTAVARVVRDELPKPDSK